MARPRYSVFERCSLTQKEIEGNKARPRQQKGLLFPPETRYDFPREISKESRKEER
jgi:hypothetical protein